MGRWFKNFAHISDWGGYRSIAGGADGPPLPKQPRRRYQLRHRDRGARAVGLSPNLIKAVVSVEDQRFYEHSGVDVIRVAAAVVRNLEQGRRAEGGSTITQQLARQSFLSRDKTYRRKLKEVILAAHIEHDVLARTRSSSCT